MKKITLVLILGLLSVSSYSQEDKSMNCGGVERWSEKVLVDAGVSSINFTPVTKTVTQLTQLVTPSPSTTMPRSCPAECQVYTVSCIITIKKAETDNDYHLVLSDGSNTMIGEIPDPACSAAASSTYVSNYIACRNFIDAHIASGNVSGLSLAVIVTGVAFVDPPHGQTGAAPNNLELHPIIDISVPTGIIDNNRILDVTIGPNPFDISTQIKVNSLNNISNCSLTLFDLTGREVRNVVVPVADNKIDYTLVKDDLQQGMYIYRLRTNGLILYEGMIVVK